MKTPLFLKLLIGLVSLTCAASGAEPEVPKGYVLFEGDILVPQDSLLLKPGAAPQAVFTTNSLWPNGVVPYEFDANVTPANQTAMIAAMAVWENVATVDFRPRNGEADFVHIQSSTANNSAVGRQGGSQVINITSWNSTYIIAHELGHCLAFWHEQSRGDRDSFVQINLANVQAGQEGNFSIHNEATHYGPYDFDSLMHYDQCAFSKDCPAGQTCGCTKTTIDVLPPFDVQWQGAIGQRAHLSALDAMTMSFIYPRGDWLFVDANNTSPSQSGRFLSPYALFSQGATYVPSGGTVWIQPGSYAGNGTYTKPMTLKAPLGGVLLR